MTTSAIVAKVWSYCNALRDDDVGYGDYLEQLTYRIFLKMADEYSQPPHNKILGIPEAYNWNSRTSKSGSELEAHLENLPEPDEFAAEIIENLEAGLNSFRDVLAALGTSSVG